MAVDTPPSPEDPATQTQPTTQPVTHLEAKYDGRMMLEVPAPVQRALGLRDGQAVSWSVDPGGRLVLTPTSLGGQDNEEGLEGFLPEALWEPMSRRRRW